MSRELNPTKEKILRAARTLLESGGGSLVRMSDIARAAGVSRQAVYLHYPSRAELLVAVTRWMDQVHAVDDRLAASRTAPDGVTRLEAFIAAWGGYIPEIHGVAQALMAMCPGDAEARAAWDDRMAAVRHGCAAAVAALDAEGRLAPDLSPEAATDLLWMLLSVRNWEQLRMTCGWTQEAYEAQMKATARAMLVARA